MKFTMALLQCRYNRVFTLITGYPVEIDKKKILKLIKRMQRRKEADHNKKRLPCKMPSLEWFLADAKYMYRRTGVRCKICVQTYKPIWMYPKPSKLHPFTCTPIKSYYLIPLPTWWDGSVAVRWL